VLSAQLGCCGTISPARQQEGRPALLFSIDGMGLYNFVARKRVGRSALSSSRPVSPFANEASFLGRSGHSGRPFISPFVPSSPGRFIAVSSAKGYAALSHPA